MFTAKDTMQGALPKLLWGKVGTWSLSCLESLLASKKRFQKLDTSGYQFMFRKLLGFWARFRRLQIKGLNCSWLENFGSRIACSSPASTFLLQYRRAWVGASDDFLFSTAPVLYEWLPNLPSTSSTASSTAFSTVMYSICLHLAV